MICDTANFSKVKKHRFLQQKNEYTNVDTLKVEVPIYPKSYTSSFYGMLK